MGPTLLLDKSALQSLSSKALLAAYRHYQLVIPPVLLHEILANYTKKAKKQNFFELLVRKFRSAEFAINVEADLLCRDELRKGFVVPFDGRAVVPGIQLDLQKAVTVTEETEHHKAVRRWLQGSVSEVEKERSAAWNREKNSADLEGFRNQFYNRFRKMGLPLPKIGRLADIPPLVDRMLCNLDPKKLLVYFTEGVRMTTVGQEAVLHRFKEAQPSSLRDFAPYSYFCFRTRMIFYTSLINNLIGTRPSNVIDLSYLLYLPFCKVFSSGDELHQQLAPLLVGNDRDFVSRLELKRDLESVQFFWEQLTASERHLWLERFGRWPPTNNLSFTYRAYRRFWLPRALCGNMADRLSPEFRARIAAEMRQATAEYQRKKGDSTAKPELIMRKTPGIAPGVEGIVIEFANPEKDLP